MVNKLSDFLSNIERENIAQATGTRMHKRLQRIDINAPAATRDTDLINKIKSCDGLIDFFGADSAAEVPVAGIINGKFISRRIDRLCIDHQKRLIRILDYKTDSAPDARRGLYIRQLMEYADLLRKIHPDYQIDLYILWLHDWRLERV